MLTLFAHIQDIIHIIFSVCTYSKNFITGKEGDLPVGFPDRFNSSLYYSQKFVPHPFWGQTFHRNTIFCED